ncbi:hypothetical protein MS5786_33710 [Klebsiella pneumoniae]|nr:hypothetical protein MS5786_33710 [Klebsiella pneumoniae]
MTMTPEFPVTEITALAIISPAPVEFKAAPSGIMNASIKTVNVSKALNVSF